jgi:hypothetical protein
LDNELFLNVKRGMDSVHSPWTARPSVHDEPMDRGGGELSGRGARRRSHAWDLTVAARGARGGDEDLYLDWHETIKGIGWMGDGGPRWRPKFLDERVLEVRR